MSRASFTVGPVDARFASGAIVALVGPNGSGKTTLLRGLLGLCGSVSGAISIDGEVLIPGSRKLRDRVAYMPDDPDEIIPELTAAEYLSFVASARASTSHGRNERRLYRQTVLHRARCLAELMDLPLNRARIGTFSHGMRSKTQLIAALMTHPPLLLLDEPRNGLDPMALLHLERLLAEMAGSGTTVLVSSHDLDWVDRLADSWIVVKEGRVVRVGALRDEAGDTKSTFFRLVG